MNFVKTLLLSCLLALPALGAVSSSAEFEFNTHMGPVAHKYQLGTLLKTPQGDLASAKLLVGNASGVAAAVTMSGDATLSNAGVLTLEAGAVEESMLAVPTADGLNAKRMIRSTFDTQVDGGAIAAYDLGEDLPANGIVSQAYFQIVNQFVDSGSGTVALHCAGADDLFAAADITGSGAGTITSGVPVGTAATMFDVGETACDLTATVAGAEQTAGKLLLFVEYVVSDPAG